MISKITFYICLICSVTILSCDEFSEVDDFENYPAFVQRLSMSELELLNEQYHSQNNGDLCSTLNEFGYTGFSRILFKDGINPCLYRQKVLEEINYSDYLLDQAMYAVAINHKFTNVTNQHLLDVKDTMALYGCTICEGPNINSVPLEWKFTFAPQIVNGVEVSDTEIVVHVDKNGVNRIWGNWLPVIDPGFVNFGSKAALELVIGEKAIFVDGNNETVEQEISETDILGEPELRFTMIKVDGGAEIHKTWYILVLNRHTNEIGWVYYISTVDGEILERKSMYSSHTASNIRLMN